MTKPTPRPAHKPVRPLIYGYDTVAQMLEAMARVRGEVKK